MNASHRGIDREQTFPRSAFLAYQSVIVRQAVQSPGGADPEERLTWAQWEAEHQA